AAGHDRLRRSGRSLHRADHDPVVQCRQRLHRLPACAGGAGDRVWLHRHQRCGEGRALPRPYSRPGRGPTLRHRQRRLRRYSRICRALVQGRRHGKRLLLVCDRHDRPVAPDLHPDARHPSQQSDHAPI
ncbi:hypothetical protein LTR94_027726, partial [Friedmanniomyces endolithicus]